MSFTVSKITQFSQPAFQCIPQNDITNAGPIGLPLNGGTLSESKYVWHAKGPCLEVRDSKSGLKVGTWTFGCILKDSNTSIVCVEEIETVNGQLPLLAVAVECTISGGLVCIFDVGSSKVIRTIQIKEKISSLHVVDSAIEVLNLPGSLRCFDGILAVGTSGGDVFLIDVCRQICEDLLQVRDELSPCQIMVIPPHKISKVEQYKEQCIKEGNHLAIHLNLITDSTTEHFTLKGPKNENKLFVNKQEVCVSKLYYCSQLTSLLIGFNFGAFQLWDLTTLNLVYTSPVCDEHLPVTHFALLEPTDDPRAFCYVWVSYSNMELYHRGLPCAVMYSFCYGSKEYHEGYGYLYQDFQFCTVRYQIELGNVHNAGGENPKGGFVLNFQPIYKQPSNKEHINKGTSDVLALTVISWTVWFKKGETQTNMLMFDLNQWYKEQMPTFSSWRESSNYMLKTGLSELILMSGNKSSQIFDFYMSSTSLSQFVGVQRLEEHFCPTSLSFDAYVLRETDIVVIHSEGLQKALLSQIEAAGPLCLIRPYDVYQQIINIGMVPLFVDIPTNTTLPIDLQREIILDVGLEHHLIGWLCKCALEWANGSFSSAGCSLEVLLNWAFCRAVTLKTTCDKYCIPLFDYSQLSLDNNTSILLNSCTRQINHLCMFYTFVSGKLYEYLSFPDIIEEQSTSLNMVSVYFEVLVWLVNVGLLPECHPSAYLKLNSSERMKAPYPINELTDYYNERRAQLRLLSKDSFACSDRLLFIDNLISIKCGAEKLQKQWQDDGGSGLYPPPSLQSLLRSYLVPDTNLLYKHCLVIYLFLDLAMTLDQSKYSRVITHLIKFPAVFKVPPSLIKITQAFWQLDHGDFGSAMELLLDPQISNSDLQPWQHNVALRALILQDQCNLALFYMQVKKTPINNENDILTAISLFVANNMLDEAFYFKKQHNSNEQMLLLHLFHECNKNESLRTVLYKYLSTEEEKAFFSYLKSVNNPSHDDLQIFYYLLRARFIEAFDAHSGIKRRNPDSQGLMGQRHASVSDHVVGIFKKYLPAVSRNLVDYVRKERTTVWKKVARPTPLSVFVHDNNEQIHYKSTMIHAALSKAKSTFLDDKLKDLTTEETPFLRTPTAIRTKNIHPAILITPMVIDDDKESPSPAKRIKLSPRSSVSPKHGYPSYTKMLTPIVKRKTSVDQELKTDATPHSILKVKSQDDAMQESFDNGVRLDKAAKFISEVFQNTPKRTHVQFDDTMQDPASFGSPSMGQINVSLEDRILQEAANEEQRRLSLSNDSFSLEDRILQEAANEKQGKLSLHSKDISVMVPTSSGSETFYSPRNSLEEEFKVHKKSEVIESTNIVEDKIITEEGERTRNATDILQSPRARRSYKRSYPETPSVEPRITRSTASANTSSESVGSPSSLDSPRYSPRLAQKVKGRKSLGRKVLEHNAFSKLQSPGRVLTKEFTSVKKETTTLKEKSLNYTTDISIESDLELSATITDETRSYYQTKSVSKKESLQTIEDFDLSASVNDSFISDLANEAVESIILPKMKIKTDQGEKNDSNEDSDEDTKSCQRDSFEGSDLPKLTGDTFISHLASEAAESVILKRMKCKSDQREKNEDENVDVDVSSSKVEDKNDKYIETIVNAEETKEDNHDASVESSQLIDDQEDFIIPKDSDHLHQAAEASAFISYIADEFMEGLMPNIKSNKVTEEEQKRQPKENKSDNQGNIAGQELEVGSSSSIEKLERPVGDGVTFSKPKEEIVFGNNRFKIDNEGDQHKCFIELDAVESKNIVKAAGDGLESFSKTISTVELEKALITKRCVYRDLSSSSEDEQDNRGEKPNCQTSEIKACVQDTSAKEEISSDLNRCNLLADASKHTQELLPNSNKTSFEEETRKIEIYQDLSSSSNDIVMSHNESEELQNDYDELESNVFSTNKDEPQQKLSDPSWTIVAVNVEEANESNVICISSSSNSYDSERKESFTSETSYSSSSSDDTSEGGSEQDLGSDGDTNENKLEVHPQSYDNATEKVEHVLDLRSKSPCQEKDYICSQQPHSRDVKTNKGNQEEQFFIRDAEAVELETKFKTVEEVSVEDKSTQVGDSSKTGKTKQAKARTVIKESNFDKINTVAKPSGVSKDPLEQEHKTKGRSEEYTSSSQSDTTEGDAEKELVVTAEVHIPTPRKKVQEPLIKRITRRNSALIAQEITNVKPSTTDAEKMDVNKDDRETQEDKKPAPRKTRSLSFTEGHTVTRKRLLRSSNNDSIDVLNESRRGKKKTMSIDELPIIVEDTELKVKSMYGSKKAQSLVEGYTTTRRLTRKQASMLKNATISESDEMEKLEEGDPFDPIALLDKTPFQGNPDSEEEKVYQNSSPSDSTVSSTNKPARRMTRSASVASDTSLVQENLVLTPKRRGRSSSQAKSSVSTPTGIKTRSRKQSDASSIMSNNSETPSPTKKSKKKGVDAEETLASRKSTRGRTASVSSKKSGSTSSRRK